jgi:hypothetical protein
MSERFRRFPKLRPRAARPLLAVEMQLMLLNIVRSINFLIRVADDLGTKTADRQNKMTKMEHKSPEALSF